MPRRASRKAGNPLAASVRTLGLLKVDEATGTTLRALCEEGALEGGLSIALDVRPDEAIGPLCMLMGGAARRLRVLDVREEPFTLYVRLDDLEEGWDVPDVRALVHNLNDLFQRDVPTRAIAVLGEWEDALQLWCVPKAKLEALFASREFEPENEDSLRRSFVER